MITSPKSFLAEIQDSKGHIPAGKLAYFQERQRNRLYDFIVGLFKQKEESGQLSKAELARRINKKPEQITRWLSTPGNWELDTISDLILGICGAEVGFFISPLAEARHNFKQIDLLSSQATTSSPLKTKIRTNFTLEKACAA